MNTLNTRNQNPDLGPLRAVVEGAVKDLLLEIAPNLRGSPVLTSPEMAAIHDALVALLASLVHDGYPGFEHEPSELVRRLMVYSLYTSKTGGYGGGPVAAINGYPVRPRCDLLAKEYASLGPMSRYAATPLGKVFALLLQLWRSLETPAYLDASTVTGCAVCCVTAMQEVLIMWQGPAAYPELQPRLILDLTSETLADHYAMVHDLMHEEYSHDDIRAMFRLAGSLQANQPGSAYHSYPSGISGLGLLPARTELTIPAGAQLLDDAFNLRSNYRVHGTLALKPTDTPAVSVLRFRPAAHPLVWSHVVAALEDLMSRYTKYITSEKEKFYSTAKKED